MKDRLTMPKLLFLLFQVITIAILAVSATGHFGMADGLRITTAYLVAYLLPCMVLSRARGSSMMAQVLLLLVAAFLFYIDFKRLIIWTAPDGCSLQLPDIQGDARHYYKWALYKYNGTPEEVHMVYPGFPMLMLGLWKILGLNVVWPQALNLMFTLLSVVLTGMTTRRLLLHRVQVSPRTLIAGGMGLMGMLPYFLVMGTTLLKEGSVMVSLAMSGFALSSLSASDQERHWPWRDIILLVMAGILLALVRTTYLYFVIIGVIIMAIPHWRRDWRMAMSMLLVMGLLLALGDYFSAYSFDRHAEIAGGGWNMQRTYVIGESQKFYREFLDYYFLYSVWHKVILLPLTMAVQFLLPFPWSYDGIISVIGSASRLTFGWYFIGGTALFYYFYLSLRKHNNMGMWPWWPALLFAAVAYLMAGSVARYVVPFQLLFVPVAMYVLCLLHEGHWRKPYLWWLAILVVMLIVTLLLCFELQKATISQMLGLPPLGDYLIQFFN